MRWNFSLLLLAATPIIALPTLPNELISNDNTELNSIGLPQSQESTVTEGDVIIEMPQLTHLQSRCPICLDQFQSPLDISVLTIDGKRICEHAYCKECASLMIFGNQISGEYNKRCCICHEPFDGMLIFNINDHEKLFHLFDLDNDGTISSRDFEKALKVLQLQNSTKVQEIFNEFATPSADKMFITKHHFPQFWAAMIQEFNEWFTAPSQIADDRVLTAPVRRQQRINTGTSGFAELIELVGRAEADRMVQLYVSRQLHDIDREMEQQVTRLVYGSGGRALAHRYSRWIMRRPMNFIITFAVPLIGGVIAFVVGTFRNTIAIPAAIGSCCFGLALLNLLILLLAKEF